MTTSNVKIGFTVKRICVGDEPTENHQLNLQLHTESLLVVDLFTALVQSHGSHTPARCFQRNICKNPTVHYQTDPVGVCLVCLVFSNNGEYTTSGLAFSLLTQALLLK